MDEGHGDIRNFQRIGFRCSACPAYQIDDAIVSSSDAQRQCVSPCKPTVHVGQIPAVHGLLADLPK
jgi:hypothetical protein